MLSLKFEKKIILIFINMIFIHSYLNVQFLSSSFATHTLHAINAAVGHSLFEVSLGPYSSAHTDEFSYFVEAFSYKITVQLFIFESICFNIHDSVLV